ncbi:MAG TPA: HlyD family efflux transporter periplasmic adaptor subunit, partial [Candidatus Methylomirabilis sp.]|nr:HlyD family efflux transporter periplasmic adaptor subunit [Candidatus Methylomirabilis sp.]
MPAPFLWKAAPPWAANGLAWVVILVVIGGAVALVLVHVPETVSSEFRLVPTRGADPVRAARSGRIMDVLVEEGTAVAKGQTLFVIRSNTVGDQSAEMATLEKQATGALSARANARARYESQRRADEEQARGLTERNAHVAERIESHRTLGVNRETKFQTNLRIAESEVASIRAEIEFKKKHLAVAEEIAVRYKKGYESNLLSWQEYIRAQVEATRVSVEFEQLQRQLEIAQLKVSQLHAERESDETEWKIAMAKLVAEQDEVRATAERLRHESDARAVEYREVDRRLMEDLEKATIRSEAVRGALVDVHGNQLSMLAPCAGPVVRLAVKRRDAVVQEGETLGEVACAGDRLEAELAVPPSGVGKIRLGQSVKLRYEAFPYERYGVRYATIAWISSVGAVGKDGPMFRAVAALREQAMTIEGRPQ